MRSQPLFIVAITLVTAAVAVGFAPALRQKPPAETPPKETPRQHSPFATRKALGPGQGSVTTEFAVLHGMRWLARHQEEDGSWSAKTLPLRCKSTPPCSQAITETDEGTDIALTALAIEGFLAGGYHTTSQQSVVDKVSAQRFPIGDIVSKGLAWIVASQKPDGSFASTRDGLNVNALATMVLAEAYGMTHDETFKVPTEKALRFLCSKQLASPDGKGRFGWSPDESDPAAPPSDPIATAWAVCALNSARLSGLNVDPEAFAGAASYAAWADEDERIKQKNELAALTAYIRFTTAPVKSADYLARAEQALRAHPPSKWTKLSFVDMTRLHFASLLMVQLENPQSALKHSEAWTTYDKALVDAVYGSQTVADTCSSGGWFCEGSSTCDATSLYATTLGILASEVYLRYAPSFPAPPPPPAPPKQPPTKKK